MVAILKQKTEKKQQPDPLDLHLGARLRLRRTVMALTQQQLGEATGLTFQQIQKYENGSNRMSASRLYQLALLLGVTPAFFFDEMPPPVPSDGFGEAAQAPLEDMPKPDTEMLHRRETLELIRAYYSITDVKQRRKIYELIKSMRD